jgi:hypothetical protein
LTPLPRAAGVELDQTEQVGQIGQRQRRHAIAGGALDGIADADDAVGDGVFGMQAEMDVARGIHRRHFNPAVLIWPAAP